MSEDPDKLWYCQDCKVWASDGHLCEPECEEGTAFDWLDPPPP